MSLSAAANHHIKRKRRLPPSALPIAATSASASALLLAVQVGGAAPRSAEARRASTGKQVSATNANHIDGYDDDDDADGLRAFQDTVRGRQRVRAVRRSVDFLRPLDWFNRTQNDMILASW